jgi:hypothetical protein
MKPKDPRMPLPIYIPELNEQSKKGLTGSSSAQGSALPAITTEEIEKKLS